MEFQALKLVAISVLALTLSNPGLAKTKCAAPGRPPVGKAANINSLDAWRTKQASYLRCLKAVSTPKLKSAKAEAKRLKAQANKLLH